MESTVVEEVKAEGRMRAATFLISDHIEWINGCLSQRSPEEIAPYFNGIHKMEELKETMTSIKAQVLVLFEGQSDQVFQNPQVVHWLEKTSSVLSELKALCQEVVAAPKMRKTIIYATIKKLIFQPGADTKSICREMSQKVRRKMEELEATKSEGDMLGQLLAGLAFSAANYQDTRSSEKSCAHIPELHVVGRDQEKLAIKRMILAYDNDGENISVIPIVGIGGIGKTTLAQLVYNDADVDQHFDLKAWVPFPHGSSVAGLAVTIFKSMFEELGEGGWAQDQLREAVEDKTYLLVLDDVWDNDCKTWLELWNLKCLGGQGSKIIVTTSSKEVAQIMGTVLPYELRGLQEYQSWELLKRMALPGPGVEHVRTVYLTRIGIEICRKCAYIPLAIRTVGAMLRGSEVSTWEDIRDTESIVRCISPEGNKSSLLSTWERSYNRLPEHVKQCFLYCSLFPKGYEFYKSDLIHLWISQRVIGPSDGSGSSAWDLGSQCLTKLVDRYFLQDAKKDGSGNIISCTMNVLMFEFVQHLAGDEFFIFYGLPVPPFDEFRYNTLSHLSFIIDSHWEAPLWLPATENLQSLFLLPCRNNHLVGSDVSASSWLYEFTDSSYLDKMFSSLRVLCALDLAAVNCENLPSSVGKLKQLRYLRLGGCESLPQGITRLLNLEILDLRLSLVRQLPTDFNELINLKHLHIGDSLIHLLPVFWKQRTSLGQINLFGAGENLELTTVASLTDLDGKVEFHHEKNRATATSNVTAKFLNDQERAFLSFTWSLISAAETVSGEGESWVPEPPPHLEFLGIWCRGGIPNNDYKFNYSPVSLSLLCWKWETKVFSFMLPTIVSLNIQDCSGFHHLTALSWLPHLKNLQLWNLKDLVYIEEEMEGNNKRRIFSDEAVASYFPSLERLELYELPQLKEWFRGEFKLPPVPRLVELKVSGCPRLMLMPQVQRLESLEANQIHEALLGHLLLARKSEKKFKDVSTYPNSTVRELYIASIRELYSFSVDEFSVESMMITNCQQLYELTASDSASTSLRRLEIASCGRLRDISPALQNLLEELVIDGCNNLELGDTEHLERLRSLRSFTVRNMTKLDSIPIGLGCVTTLQELYISWLYNETVLPADIGMLAQLRLLDIRYCYRLSALPESFGNLKDLQHLRIVECPKLERRCQQPDGKDWHLIQHIPDIVVGTRVTTLHRNNSCSLKQNGYLKQETQQTITAHDEDGL